MAHAGAIRPLVKLLKDEAPSVREEAAAALGNLVFFNDETNAGNQAPVHAMRLYLHSSIRLNLLLSIIRSFNIWHHDCE